MIKFGVSSIKLFCSTLCRRKQEKNSCARSLLLSNSYSPSSSCFVGVTFKLPLFECVAARKPSCLISSECTLIQLQLQIVKVNTATKQANRVNRNAFGFLQKSDSILRLMPGQSLVVTRERTKPRLNAAFEGFRNK